MKEELDYFFRQIKTLDIPIKEITDMYREFCKKNSKINIMKRTTYILIGLFVAGLCVLVGGMFMIFV